VFDILHLSRFVSLGEPVDSVDLPGFPIPSLDARSSDRPYKSRVIIILSQLDLMWGDERRIWVRILVSRGFDAVNTVFGGDFVCGMKDSFSTRT
jgi:hypothetical protein